MSAYVVGRDANLIGERKDLTDVRFHYIFMIDLNWWIIDSDAQFELITALIKESPLTS